MAVRRRVGAAGPDGWVNRTGLPDDIARGPVVSRWAAHPSDRPGAWPLADTVLAWQMAAGRWCQQNGLDYLAWRDMIDPEVVRAADRLRNDCMIAKYGPPRGAARDGRHPSEFLPPQPDRYPWD